MSMMSDDPPLPAFAETNGYHEFGIQTNDDSKETDPLVGVSGHYDDDIQLSLADISGNIPIPVRRAIQRRPICYKCKHNICNKCCIFRIQIRFGTGFGRSITIAKILFMLIR